MPPATETENFIKTLAELRDEECELRKAELRLRIRMHARRFVEEFRVGFQDRLPAARPEASGAGQNHVGSN